MERELESTSEKFRAERGTQTKGPATPEGVLTPLLPGDLAGGEMLIEPEAREAREG